MHLKCSFKSLISYIKNAFTVDAETKLQRFWVKAFFTSIIIAIVFSTLSQLPIFVDTGLNTFTLFFWIVVLLVALLADYKLILTWLFNSFIFIVPFLIYSLFGLLFKINYFTSNMFRLLLQASILLGIGSFSKHKLRIDQIKFLGHIFCFSCFLLATIIFVTVIVPSLGNISGPIYVYTSKNSTSPILFCSSIILFFLSNKKIHNLISFVYFFYIVAFIFLVKCRTVLIAVLPVLFVLIYKFGSSKLFFITLIATFTVFSIVFFIPSLNALIIQKMILNNKTNWDDIFSGRLSLIAENVGKIRFFFGSPGFYVDCMPVSMIINDGIFGFILLLPLVLLPLYITIKTKNSYIKILSICLCIAFYLNSILEGYGIFGPGNKVLILWLFFGYSYSEVYSGHKVFKNFFIFSKSKISLIPESAFFTFLLCGFVAASVLLGTSPTLNSMASEKILTRFDSNKGNPEYIYPERLTFDETNETTFCVGQSYTFNYTIYPENSTDKAIHPLAWSVSADTVSFDLGNEVRAHFYKPAQFMIDTYSEKVKNVRTQNFIHVVDPSDYSFNKILIGTLDGEQISLDINQRKTITFDKDYIPDINYLKFISSDESVAKVINGEIIAISKGNCEIYAVGANGKSTTPSNVITVSVNNKIFKMPDEVLLDVDDQSFYTSTKYCINPTILNSHDDFKLFLNGELVGVNVCEFSTEKVGTNILKIQSVSMPEKYFDFTFAVNKLMPLSFKSGGDNWFIKKNGPQKVQLLIEFNDGSVRDAELKDLQYRYEDFKNRASRIRSGTVGNDALTFLPLFSGTSVLEYIAKEDNSVKILLPVKSSSFSQKEFATYSQNISSSISSLLLVVGTFVFSLSKQKKFYIHLIILSSCIFLFFASILLINKFDLGTVIIGAVFCIISLLIGFLITLYKKRKIIDSYIPSNCFDIHSLFLVCEKERDPFSFCVINI